MNDGYSVILPSKLDRCRNTKGTHLDEAGSGRGRVHHSKVYEDQHKLDSATFVSLFGCMVSVYLRTDFPSLGHIPRFRQPHQVKVQPKTTFISTLLIATAPMALAEKSTEQIILEIAPATASCDGDRGAMGECLTAKEAALPAMKAFGKFLHYSSHPSRCIQASLAPPLHHVLLTWLPPS
jgi:hypothetical protein